jgi:hypothetical protein
MTKPTDRSDLSPLATKGMWRVLMRSFGSTGPDLTASRSSPVSATQLAAGSAGHRPCRIDVELLDLDSTSHGFVLSLRTGGRTYLQYVTAPGANDEPVEDVEFLPMGRERYPDLRGGGIWWDDDVHELNLLLRD